MRTVVIWGICAVAMVTMLARCLSLLLRRMSDTVLNDTNNRVNIDQQGHASYVANAP